MNYRITERMSWQYCDKSTYLVNEEENIMYLLNECGGVIWRCIENKQDYSSILNKVLTYFSLNKTEIVKKDVDNLLDKLLEYKFIEVSYEK